MGYFLKRILQFEDVDFIIDGVYTLCFDMKNRVFRLYLRDEKSFFLDFNILKQVFSHLHSYYEQKLYTRGITMIPLDIANGKMLKVDCHTNDDFNYGLDYFNLQIQYIVPGGSSSSENNNNNNNVRDGQYFFMRGWNAISNFLKLQPEIEAFMREYALFETNIQLTMNIIAEMYIQMRIDRGNLFSDFQIFRATDKTEDILINDFLIFNDKMLLFVNKYKEICSVPDIMDPRDIVDVVLKTPSFRERLVHDIKVRINHFKKYHAQYLKHQINSISK